MITTAIVFDHRGRVKRGAEGPLEVRITHKRHSFYINTGVRVREKQWQFDRVVNHPQSDELNERLSIIVGKVMSNVNERLKTGREVDVQVIRNEVWNVKRDADLLDWMDAEIGRLDIEYGTQQHYKTLIKRLREWDEMRSWMDVDVDHIIAFDVWLRQQTYRSLPLSDAGIYNYHKNLKHLLNQAVMLDKLAANPYVKLRGRFERGNHESTEYLTDAEVKKIMKFKPTPDSLMETAKDLFVFQLWTGLAYQDTQAFDFSRYKKIDGTWRLTAARIKTGEPYVSQLLPPAVEVLEKYDWQTPKIINGCYNRELHKIGVACGITTRLHSHLARHTFATYMLRNGVTLEHVSKMLGHSNIKMTMRYAKVLAEDIHADFNKIKIKLTKKR